jgi:hypothetical protein
MESRFGYDFGNVRIHTGEKAADSANSFNALAYTIGNNIVFGKDNYTTNTFVGKKLLAHELIHVLQQDGTEVIKRQTANDDECPGYQPDEEKISYTNNGHLASDVMMISPTSLLIADFGVDWRHIKEVSKHDPLLKSWLYKFESDDSFQLSIIGYSDCVPSKIGNSELRQGRAKHVENLLGPSSRSRLVFRGMAGLPEYVSDNKSIEGRAKNRGVIIEFDRKISLPPEQIQSSGCPPTSIATSLADYINLILCVEHTAKGLSPREILSLIRQIYYGTESWSKTRTSFWGDVIPCGISFSHPFHILGGPLLVNLRDSQVVGGVDMGHVFTGLESMICPTSQVELEIPGPNRIVNMSNEEFATWGGDLGSAAAKKAFDETELGITKGWSHYFGTPNTLASYEDLLGDIDAWIIRSGLVLQTCGFTSQVPIHSVDKPVSTILADYYHEMSISGPNVSNRYKCFIESIGGIVLPTPSGISITNISKLIGPIYTRVKSFAETFYLKLVKDHSGILDVIIFGFSAEASAKLVRYSHSVTEQFLYWLESKL